MKNQKRSYFKNRLIGNNKGTSLVEIMVVVLIFSLLVGGFFSILTVGDNSWQANRVHIELQQELRKSMEAMVNDLRQAGPASIIDVPANGNQYDAITFRKPTGVSAGTIVWNNNTTQFFKSVVSGISKLQRATQTGPGVSTTKVLSQYISRCKFRRYAATPETLEVVLQASKSTLKGLPITYDLTFNVQLRN